MIKVLIPSNFKEERQYCLEVLLKEFLGLAYEVEQHALPEYHFVVQNGTLIVKDQFFSSVPGKDYIRCENIPTNIATVDNSTWNLERLPILFGTPAIDQSENEIICGIDLFAGAFFMLTRWEEIAIKERDRHGRFPFSSALAAKFNFHLRPIVNEYTDLLFSFLKTLSPEIKRKSRKFSILPTHDIDHVLKWKKVSDIRKKLAHQFITRKNFKIGWHNVMEVLDVKLGNAVDPYFQFDYLMDLSEKYGRQSRFYFLSGNDHKIDADFSLDDPILAPVFKAIKERNHILGIHPSYHSIHNAEDWKKEKQKLDRATKTLTTEGRQHYLRFEVPNTWNIWEQNGMTMDSTVGYAENVGFRCGCCYAFPVFDVVNRKQLALVESPLLLMEVSLMEYMQLSPDQANTLAHSLMDTVKKHNGDFVFLWHNNTIFNPEHLAYKPVYENLVSDFELHGKP